MINSETSEMIAIILNPINSDFDCVAITQCNELCNIDGGRELLRQHRNEPIPALNLHGQNVRPKLILTTPNCKEIAYKEAKKYKCPVQLLF